jgi:NADPH-dependent ferric siderophore reductase
MAADSRDRPEGIATPPMPAPRTFDLEVVLVEDWTDTLRRIVLGAESLRQLDYRPGQDLMLKVESGRGPVNRRYTIRAADLRRGEVEIDVVGHGSGPGARWAASARPGDRLLEVVAPRGKITIQKDAAWHLFIGDETAIPAMFHMAESLPAPRRALVLLEVGRASEAPQPPAGLRGAVNFVDRSGAPPGADGPLLAAAAELDLPSGWGRAYIAGETATVLALRDLLQRRGLTRDQMAVKAYWRRDQPNLDRGEPEPPE